MAVGSINGVITGKLGNMVGQTNQLVNSKVKQVWRQYTGSVKNPKTISQAQQRSLFVSAKNFATAFRGILDHSFQGVEYGQRSLNRFRQLVLANGGQNFPNFTYQPKGAQNFIPQPWPVSRGSIVTGGPLTEAGVNDVILTFGHDDAANEATLGELWQTFLASNPLLRDGDMLTFLVVADYNQLALRNGALDSFYSVYDRIIIDTADTTPVIDVALSAIPTQAGIMTINFFDTTDDLHVSLVNGDTTVGLACIVSRQNGSKASWQRSNSDMAVQSQYQDILNSNDNITAALDSFMASADAATSDWYLNETGGTTGGSAQTALVRERTLTINGPTAGATTSALAAYFSSGARNGYLYTDQGVHRSYYRINGRVLTPVSLETGYSFATTDIINISLVMTELEREGYTISGSGGGGGDEQPE